MPVGVVAVLDGPQHRAGSRTAASSSATSRASGIPPLFDVVGRARATWSRRWCKTNCIPDGTKLWWDVRPNWKYPTLEFRICDVCTRVDEAVCIAAIFQALIAKLWKLRRDNMTFRVYPLSLIEENKWRAVRYGLDGKLLDLGKQEEVPARELIRELIEWFLRRRDRRAGHAEGDRVRLQDPGERRQCRAAGGDVQPDRRPEGGGRSADRGDGGGCWRRASVLACFGTSEDACATTRIVASLTPASALRLASIHSRLPSRLDVEPADAFRLRLLFAVCLCGLIAAAALAVRAAEAGAVSADHARQMAAGRELFAQVRPPAARRELPEVPRRRPRRAAGSTWPPARRCSRAATTAPSSRPARRKASKLYRLAARLDEPHMPPKGNKPLTQAQLADLAKWIDLGAAYDKPLVEQAPAAKPKALVVTAEDRNFWSFRPLTRPAVPAVKDAGWARNAVDRFILAKLEAKGLDADRRGRPPHAAPPR